MKRFVPGNGISNKNICLILWQIEESTISVAGNECDRSEVINTGNSKGYRARFSYVGEFVPPAETQNPVAQGGNNGLRRKVIQRLVMVGFDS
ncbi:MAG: hypothetical protein V7L11_15410 [Nostoc sp.]|uniref:hypothetical protein n=1 Tax=Nostoc sp. TaxID=1180 RepID=UPI002FF4E08A